MDEFIRRSKAKLINNNLKALNFREGLCFKEKYKEIHLDKDCHVGSHGGKPLSGVPIKFYNVEGKSL